jgi:hypothetical protein
LSASNGDLQSAGSDRSVSKPDEIEHRRALKQHPSFPDAAYDLLAAIIGQAASEDERRSA